MSDRVDGMRGVRRERERRKDRIREGICCSCAIEDHPGCARAMIGCLLDRTQRRSRGPQEDRGGGAERQEREVGRETAATEEEEEETERTRRGGRETERTNEKQRHDEQTELLRPHEDVDDNEKRERKCRWKEPEL